MQRTVGSLPVRHVPVGDFFTKTMFFVSGSQYSVATRATSARIALKMLGSRYGNLVNNVRKNKTRRDTHDVRV